ncbi:hypothetical protein SETIT_4G107000v2 [Setaria italica]|uniref:Benzoate carboxyl methyltransferase n=1 Tax=Setaria italica TaxID=4555 RepID=K3Y3C0_SETIT|nr:anthranilate O-methyltransferase 1 [Setaria italica]RCV21058.1 hypothetical protein SETIT_4G107000v2 [Setaria italica]
MSMERDFHMVEGDGETSYTTNSRLQQKALFETKSVLEEAVRQVCSALLPPNLVVCDLGCGPGDNTLIFLSEVIKASSSHNVPEIQFFLNDLPGNDFSHVFRSAERFKSSVTACHKGERRLPFHIAGLSRSYYTRLFPSQSVHLFHSSYSLHWRSQLPDGLDGNKRNIYIAKATPLSVVKLYQEQFQKDLILFLELRYDELVVGGQMVLTFLGRKEEDLYSGNMNYLCELLAQSLQSLVEKDLVEEDKLNSFNLPIFGASIDEVKAAIKQTGLFDINEIKLFESNWDPYDDSEDDNVQDNIQSGVNVAKCIRAVMETLFVSHFGESILDALFKEYASKVAEYLERDKAKYSVMVLSLQRR